MIGAMVEWQLIVVAEALEEMSGPCERLKETPEGDGVGDPSPLTPH